MSGTFRNENGHFHKGTSLLVKLTFEQFAFHDPNTPYGNESIYNS